MEAQADASGRAAQAEPVQAEPVIAGADIARVFDSIYLPESFGHELTPVRTRVRGGVHYGGKRVDFFYGLTWLGKEFEAQPEGQFAGTAQIRFRF